MTTPTTLTRTEEQLSLFQYREEARRVADIDASIVEARAQVARDN